MIADDGHGLSNCFAQRCSWVVDELNLNDLANLAAFHPRGRFWAAIYARAMRCRQSSAFLMDCRSARASALELKAGNALIANGLAWSPDAAIVYGADTPSQTVRA